METFIESCLKLDASILEPLIDEYQLFQDLDKFSFLQSLKNLFDALKKKNIANTYLKLAKCQGCQRGHITYEFYAKGHFQFAYILFMENDFLIDIFRCTFSTNEKLDFYPF
jgi:hypothetical protein